MRDMLRLCALKASDPEKLIADPDLWMRDAGDKYEYICVYVDGRPCMIRIQVHSWTDLRMPTFTS